MNDGSLLRQPPPPRLSSRRRRSSLLTRSQVKCIVSSCGEWNDEQILNPHLRNNISITSTSLKLAGLVHRPCYFRTNCKLK